MALFLKFANFAEIEGGEIISTFFLAKLHSFRGSRVLISKILMSFEWDERIVENCLNHVIYVCKIAYGSFIASSTHVDCIN